MATSQPDRYTDLIGKTAIVGSDDNGLLVAIAGALADNGVHVALVAADRHAVDAAAERVGADDVYAVRGDPSDAALWSRVVPQVEQRLGPIDIAIAIGEQARRAALFDMVSPDMVARGRGVTIAVGEGHLHGGAPKRRLVKPRADPAAIAAAALAGASDRLDAVALVM